MFMLWIVDLISSNTSYPLRTARTLSLAAPIIWKPVNVFPVQRTEGFCLLSKYLNMNNIKEVYFNIINRFYPCKLLLRRYKKDIVVDCSLCTQSEEDLWHLFWSFFICFLARCLYIHFPEILSGFSLTYVNVLFGFLSYPANNKDQYYIINLFYLLNTIFTNTNSRITNHLF